jgi:putative Holliday junction resolvase
VRVLGIDLGARRIGVALSDSGEVIASPYEVVQRSGDRARDHREIARLVEEAEAGLVVVGLPLSLDGSIGPAAAAAQDEAAEHAAALTVPVELFDERLTTVTAERALRSQGVKGPARRKVVDKVAAAVMLQAFLDRRAAGRQAQP